MKFFWIVFMIFSCSTPPFKNQLVKKVDIDRFMGKWYVIASIPTFLETGAHNAVEVYTQKDDYIDVHFSFNKDSFDGELEVITQKAFVQDDPSNAHWKIQLFWPLRFHYLVIDLADDYRYTAVGVPDKKNVWIMARESTLDQSDYKKILKRLDHLGYDIGQVIKVPQRAP